eukprot:TRINITY_DN3952_c0_g1_i1.p1 TRINITY_DN3952_c0_g1~~TRINITY_DN3952_c0_g1_i1.p1  ORF type:complete len:237 (-),score=51.81 TRINITY_DN3952_c0_g1_i1:383-1093(-)
MGSWKRRYFVLRGDQMIYFRDANSKSTPLGYIPLKTAKPKVDTARRGGLLIRTEESSRVWNLLADSDEVARKWYDAIYEHIKWALEQQEQRLSLGLQPPPQSRPHAATAAPQPSSLFKQGFLETREGFAVSSSLLGTLNSIRGGVSTKWKPRWFVLRGGILFKYVDKDDKRPEKIALYHANLEEFEPGVETAAFSITSKKQTTVLRAATEDHMNVWLTALSKAKLMIEATIDDISL